MIQSWPRLATTATAPTTWLSPWRTGSDSTSSGSLSEVEKKGWLDMALPCSARSTPSCRICSTAGSLMRLPARAPAPGVATTLTQEKPHAPLQDLLARRLVDALARARPGARGVDHDHRVEAAAHLVFVAAQGLPL